MGIGPTTNEVWLSDKARSLFQLNSERLTYEDFQAHVHPEDRARRDNAIKMAIATKGTYELEYRILLPNGTIRWISGRARCIGDEKGELSRLLGVSIDVTNRKQAEELFRLATEASLNGILLLNEEGKIVLVNAHIEELFGYGRDELVGQSIGLLLPERFAAEYNTHQSTFITKSHLDSQPGGEELLGRRKNGTDFPAEVGLNPIETPQGLLVLVNITDLSARKAAEEEARRRREQIDLLSRVSLLGEMTASIAHEVNQPLSAIISNANACTRFIEQGQLDAEQLREILVDIVADGQRASEIIRNVRRAVKKGSELRGRINLNDVVTTVAHMVQSDAAASFCEVQVSLAQDLPAIEGDPIQIQQVLINLVSNAFDAMRDMPPAGRKVHIATERNGDNIISGSSA